MAALNKCKVKYVIIETYKAFNEKVKVSQIGIISRNTNERVWALSYCSNR